MCIWCALLHHGFILVLSSSVLSCSNSSSIRFSVQFSLDPRGTAITQRNDGHCIFPIRWINDNIYVYIFSGKDVNHIEE